MYVLDHLRGEMWP